MNFKHLRYFWSVAKAGGVMRASEQLHTTPQTLSGQIKQLEEWLGHDLFRKRGRGLELTGTVTPRKLSCPCSTPCCASVAKGSRATSS